MSTLQPPVIVVHAITGAVLTDTYEVTPQTVWDPSTGFSHLPRRNYERILLHPEDTRYEALEPSRVRAERPVSMLYRDLIETLRHELAPSPDRPVPVFPFVYDWRQDLLSAAGELKDFIREAIERTNLIPGYDRSCECVDLVGHSMGGNVIAACLAKDPPMDAEGRGLVRRVVTLGTPFLGSVDALVKLTTGESGLFGKPRHRERNMARLTPSVYQLLPTWEGAFRVRGWSRCSIFDPACWQDSIPATIAEHLQAFGTSSNLRDPEADGPRLTRACETLRNLLEKGREVSRLIRELDIRKGLRSGKEADWLIVAGRNVRTRQNVTLTIAKHRAPGKDGPTRFFDFHAPPRWSRNLTERESWFFGDGVTPLRSAVPPWMPPERVLCLTPQDISRTELSTQTIRFATDFHAVLPLVNLVQRWVVSFLLGRQWGRLWGRTLPGCEEKWKSPVSGGRVRK